MASQKSYNGAIRAVSLYVLLVMGGTALLLNFYIAFGGNWYFDLHGYIHQGFFASLVTGITFFLKTVTSILVLAWCFIGALLYLCALFLLRLFNKPIIPGLLLAVLSLFLSAGIMIWLRPVPFASLPTLYLQMMVAGFLGALFGVFLAWRVSNLSFRTAPLGWEYRLPVALWGLVFVFGLATIAYARIKISLVKDPPIEFVYAKWSPADGEVRDETPTLSYSTLPRLKPSEIEALRAEGMTGVLVVNGGNQWPSTPVKSRVVIIMSRPIRGNVDLPKPASGDILYIQAENGWRSLPRGAPTASRKIRLSYSEPNPHQTLPGTDVSVDVGMGFGSYGINAFSWKPEEANAPLPSLLGTPIVEGTSP